MEGSDLSIALLLFLLVSERLQELLLLALGLFFIHKARFGIGTERSSEEEDVGLRPRREDVSFGSGPYWYHA